MLAARAQRRERVVIRECCRWTRARGASSIGKPCPETLTPRRGRQVAHMYLARG